MDIKIRIDAHDEFYFKFGAMFVIVSVLVFVSYYSTKNLFA